MTLAKIPVRLHRTEIAPLQPRAKLADGFPHRDIPGQSHEHTIGELVTGLVPINIGQDHVAGARVIKRLDESSRVTFTFETPQRTRGPVAGFLPEPFPRFGTVRVFQKRGHENAENLLWADGSGWRRLRRIAAKFRQRFVPGGRRPIFIRTDILTAKIKIFRKQRAIPKPDATVSGKFATDGGNLHLKLPVVVPHPLAARAVNHFISTEQTSSLVPLTAEPVRQSILIRFLSGQHAVFMPSAADPVTLALAQRHLPTKLSAPIKIFVNGGFHSVISGCQRPASLPAGIQHANGWKPKPELFTSGGKNRSANSTRSSLREIRQTTTDGTRARAALPSSESSRFAPKPMRRKNHGYAILSYIASNSFAGRTSNKFHRRLQPSRVNRRTSPSRRPVTIPCDENLEASPRRRRKAQGGTEATTRSILELSAAALPSPVVFIAGTATSRMAHQANGKPVKIRGHGEVL